MVLLVKYLDTERCMNIKTVDLPSPREVITGKVGRHGEKSCQLLMHISRRPQRRVSRNDNKSNWTSTIVWAILEMQFPAQNGNQRVRALASMCCSGPRALAEGGGGGRLCNTNFKKHVGECSGGCAWNTESTQTNSPFSPGNRFVTVLAQQKKNTNSKVNQCNIRNLMSWSKKNWLFVSVRHQRWNLELRTEKESTFMNAPNPSSQRR